MELSHHSKWYDKAPNIAKIHCNYSLQAYIWDIKGRGYKGSKNPPYPFVCGVSMESKRKNAVLRKFGAAVRRLRKMAGFTQEEFADLCEIDRSYLGGVERGERNLTLVSVIKICDALKINPSEMLADLDKWPRRKDV